MEITRYSSDRENEWNEFVGKAQNATFLFNRGFMDYHSYRFTDHSIMVYNEKGSLIACFPANETSEGEIWSHKGLTYGGLMFQKELKLPVVIDVFNQILTYYTQVGFEKLIYKAFPRFYNDLQTDEIEYCLFLNNAKLFRRDMAIAVDQFHRIKYSGNIRRDANKARKEGVRINEDDEFNQFWYNVLIPNLKNRFGVAPVHTSAEITLLKKRFPNHIKLFVARNHQGEILAGTVFFITKNVAHCQYIAANEKGRQSGALNFLFTSLLDDYCKDKRYFDFGIANDENGRKLNTGLLAWKERMGGRAYSHDFYEIVLSN